MVLRLSPLVVALAVVPAVAQDANNGLGTPLFDGKSLNGWKETDFAARGPVEVKDGRILLGMGEYLTGITFEGRPPRQNYEISLEAMRVEGSDFFCGLTFPVGESHCTFVLGGWGGATVGISSIDGQDASENETTQYITFQNNRWYRVRVRVTTDRIQAWLDDKQVVDLSTQGKEITMRAGEIEKSKPLGLASWRTTAALRNIRLRKFSAD